MAPALTDYRVLTFDCYGTLIDWETGIWDALQPLLGTSETEIRRGDALAAFAELESSHEAATPTARYPEILERVHRDLAEALDCRTSVRLDRDFGMSVANWPSFDDSHDALERLAADFALVILSNVDNTSFTRSAERLAIEFDAVYTAEDIGSFKPDPKNFEYLLTHIRGRFGFGPDDILHTAQSLFHDHIPAKRIGLSTCWIDRQRLSDEGDWGATVTVEAPPEPDFRFVTMSEMADAVEELRSR